MELQCENFTVVYVFFIHFFFFVDETGDFWDSRKMKGPSLFFSVIFTYSILITSQVFSTYLLDNIIALLEIRICLIVKAIGGFGLTSTIILLREN